MRALALAALLLAGCDRLIEELRYDCTWYDLGTTHARAVCYDRVLRKECDLFSGSPRRCTGGRFDEINENYDKLMRGGR